MKHKSVPLHMLVAQRMPEGKTVSDLARVLNVRPQTLYGWQRMSRENAKFRVPSGRARSIARFFHVRPADVRPDLFEPTWVEPRTLL